VNKIVKKTLPILLTSAAVIVALLVLRQLWVYYMDEPWTRDAHVGADVVQVAPDVSGLVESVNVADNQAVKKGDVLFVVDRARYRIALEQAKASLAERQASVAQLRREIGRGDWRIIRLAGHINRLCAVVYLHNGIARISRQLTNFI